jgi:hypothetical protein
MKDLIEKVVGYLPSYFLDAGRLFAHPKEFLVEKNINSDDGFVAAVLFAAVTIAIIFIFFIPLSTQSGDLWTRLGIVCANLAVSVVLTSLCVLGGWRLVGWKGSAKVVFSVVIYYVAMMNAILAAFTLVSFGLLKAYAPEIFDEYQTLEEKYDRNISQLLIDWLPTIQDRPGLDVVRFSLVLMALGLLAPFIWFITGWGVFRQINGLRRWRSAVAFLITVIFLLAVSFIAYFVYVATWTK